MSRSGTMYLKSFAGWVAETGVLTRPDGGSIFDALKAPKTPKTKRQALTEEDLDAIWAVLAVRPKRERYRAIALVRLLDATGLRRAGVGSILFNDVEFDDSGGGRSLARMLAVSLSSSVEVRRVATRGSVIMADTRLFVGYTFSRKRLASEASKWVRRCRCLSTVQAADAIAACQSVAVGICS